MFADSLTPSGSRTDSGVRVPGAMPPAITSHAFSVNKAPSLTAPPQPGCPAGDPGVGLLPDDRVTPQKMFFDFRAGESVGAEVTDVAHRWIRIVLFVCSPGGAHFTRRLQAAVANQSQADAHTHRDDVQESIDHAGAREKVSFGLKQIEDNQNAAGVQSALQLQN